MKEDEEGEPEELEVVAVNLPQDLIPTVVPPFRRKRVDPTLQAQEGERALSPDEVPTERPPTTLPAESEERPKAGAPKLPQVKKA